MNKVPWETLVSLKTFEEENPLPETPGVYFFMDNRERILYIGKATSLRDRVRSYFSQDILVTRGPKIATMLEKIASIGYSVTDSVLEALLLESRLIKEYQPPYNTDAKDNKSFVNIVITDEDYPRILVVRERDREKGKFTDPLRSVYGPFPSAQTARATLKILRKLFPFRDTCVPYDEQSVREQAKARGCFSYQIGLCPGVCVGEITQEAYQKRVRDIEKMFEGKKKSIVREAQKEMNRLAKEEHFEEAADKRNFLFALEHIQDVVLVQQDREVEDRHRIEGFDVAHMSGQAAVGVMTVVQKGRVVKSEYKKFLLRRHHNRDDLSALREILERRFAHTEWLYPEIVVIDGGKVHKKVAEDFFAEQNIGVVVVSVVKDERHRPKEILGELEIVERFRKEILLVNAEAHRFAIAFHKERRAKEFLGKK